MLKSSKEGTTCVLLLPSLWSCSLEAGAMASQCCAQQQYQGRTRYLRLAKPFPAHSQDLMTTHPMREPQCYSKGDLSASQQGCFHHPCVLNPSTQGSVPHTPVGHTTAAR